MTCEFSTGIFEGEVTELVPSVSDLNHQYSFQYKYRVMVDHRGRKFRMALEEGSQAIQSFDRTWVNQNCYSSKEDWNILIGLWGRDGMKEDYMVNCQGIIGTIAQLRKRNIILLQNDYLFAQIDCEIYEEDASALPENEVDDSARSTEPMEEETPAASSNNGGGVSTPQ